MAVLAQVILAPAAGALIGWFGVSVAFAVNGASFVLSALLLAGAQQGRDRSAAALRTWPAVREGVNIVRQSELLRRLAIVQVLASLSAGATGGLLVVLAAERLGVGPGGFGLLLAAIGVGAVAGPTLFARVIRPGHRGWLFGPYAVRGCVDLVLASTQSPVVAGAALVSYGGSTSTGMVAYQSTLQTSVPVQIRGRAFAFYDVLWNGTRLLSLGAGALLADAVGIRGVYVLGGLLLLAAAASGSRVSLRGT